MAVIADEVRESVLQSISLVGRRYPVAAAFVFGSYAEGSAHEDSDIDLAVFVRGGEEIGLRQRCGLASLVQKEVGDEIELHIFPETALHERVRASFAAFVVEHGVRMDLSQVPQNG